MSKSDDRSLEFHKAKTRESLKALINALVFCEIKWLSKVYCENYKAMTACFTKNNGKPIKENNHRTEYNNYHTNKLLSLADAIDQLQIDIKYILTAYVGWEPEEELNGKKQQG